MHEKNCVKYLINGTIFKKRFKKSLVVRPSPTLMLLWRDISALRDEC